jgi:hypothetical protein
MNVKRQKRSPLPQAFVKAISAKAEQEENKPIPKNMDFPIWDEMEMDVPYLGSHMQGEREFPEDESNVDMDCLIHVSPTLAMSSLAI